jgi:NAD(P)-dependent dehydrogenase (short-subunit alcohol dehydrogenase family)
MPENLSRYRLELIEAKPSGLTQTNLLGAEVFVTGGGEVLDAAVVGALRSRGVDARTGADLPDNAVACVYLGGLRDVVDEDEAAGINREAFRVAHRLGRTLEAGGGLFVTVQDTGGAFGLGPIDGRRAWLGGLPALVKTAGHEWPLASVKAIDLERGGRGPQELARVLTDELLEGGGEIEVALPSRGGRFTVHTVDEPVVRGEPVIGPGDVVAVSGGARGVTATCLQAWAKECGARFVLLGRTQLTAEPSFLAGIDDEAELIKALLGAARDVGDSPSPAELRTQVQHIVANREIRKNLSGITKAGGVARYEAVDVCDLPAVTAVLDHVRADWGPITGLIHTAGVLADKMISEKTDEQFDYVFDTKVAGLQALLAATSEDPLKLLCVFSSIAGRSGNKGQADYAMANEVLAKVAESEHQRRPGLRVKSLAWGPWEGGMVTPALKRRFAALGVPMIPLAVGARMFADEMSAAQHGQVELVLGGRPRAEALLTDGAEAKVNELEFSVAADTHGYLRGHAMGGAPVLPMVLAAEWLSRAARSFRPGMQHVALRDITVRKGVLLTGFDDGGDRFALQARPSSDRSDSTLCMELRGSGGVLHYSVSVEELGEWLTEDGLPDLALDAWDGEPLYGDVLFHRGDFELIEELHGISDEGASGQVRGVERAGWPGGPWLMDVAALDGALQLAVVYGHRMLGGANLPAAIDELRYFRSGPITGRVTATVFSRKVSDISVTTDIVLIDELGQRVAELWGVHNYALPG